MTVHAFVDESERPPHYLLCVALVDPGQLAPVRRRLRELLLPGQRELHFKKEKPIRRRTLADRIAGLPVTARVYSATCTKGSQEAARQRCVERLVEDLLNMRAQRLVLDSRQEQDKGDQATIYRVFGRHSTSTDLVHQHMNSTSVPLLWVPDAVAWCYGAGGDWRRRVMPVITDVIDVQASAKPVTRPSGRTTGSLLGPKGASRLNSSSSARSRHRRLD